MKIFQIFSFLLVSVFLLSACSSNKAPENTLESDTISITETEPKANNTSDNDEEEASEKELETEIAEDIDYSNYKPRYLYTIKEDGYDHYGVEVDQKGTRLFKKDGDDFEYLGSTTEQLIPFSIITSKAGQDTIYFNYFMPETDAPRSGIVSFKVENYPHDNFEDLEAGSDFISFNIDELISPDRTKILLVNLIQGITGKNNKDELYLIDLEEKSKILIESFDETSQYTLNDGEYGFGGAKAQVRWIDNDTVEYNVYKIIDSADEDMDVVEFFETRIYKIESLAT